MPTAPSEYKYSVDAFELNKYSTDKESFPSIYGVKFNKSKSVMVDSNVIYRVTVLYIGETLNTVITDGGVAIPGNGTVKSRVLSTGPYATFKEKVKAICDVKGIRTIEDKYYDFTLVPKGINGTVSPLFTVQVQINGIWADVTAVSGPSTPSSIFSKKETPPGVPENVSRTDAGFAFGQNPEYEWCGKTRTWARRWLSGAKQLDRTADEVKKGLGPKWEVSISVKYLDEIGNPVNGMKEEFFGGGKEINYNFNKPNSKWQQAKKKLADHKNCNLTSGGGGGGGGGNATPTPESVKKAADFNPYPHIATRHFSARITGEEISYENANVYDQLASFYVDPEIVDLPDKKQNELPGGKSAQLNRFWGFRFLFNPSYITYNMSSNNQVDWTRPNENNAALVASGIGGTISVNILLDRVADMATMKQWKKNGGGSLPQGNYPISMDAEQCAGILHRGTEYDLEYLFRVLNGNPQKVILMGESPKDGLELLSANMGYITQLPFIFKISERQRYKVIMQGINVSHEMFTRDMIPIRTVVQINLERLPDLVSGDFKKFKQAEAINKVTQVIKGPSASDIIASRRQRDGFL